MKRNSTVVTWVLVLELVAVSLCGCALGPKQINVGHLKYNEAIHRTFREELLLNLVRMKYRELPEFVDVGGIAAQYSFESSFGMDANFLGQFFGFNPNQAGVKGNLARTERPTITYAPLRGQEFAKRILSPINIATIALLSNKGWAIDRLFRMTVSSLNYVDNATAAGGPTPACKPDYERFLHVSQVIRRLQQQRAIELAVADRKDIKPVPVAASTLDGEFFMNALSKGYDVKTQGERVTLERTESYVALVVHPHAVGSAEVVEMASQLNLEPGRTLFEVDMGAKGQILKTYDPELFPAANADADAGLPPALPPDPAIYAPRMRQDITLKTRSIIEMMFYLSQGVEVPESHKKAGLVTVTLDEKNCPYDWQRLLGGLFQVRESKHRPLKAAVAVKYRDHWFYIADDDLESKTTLGLLEELFNLEVRAGINGDLPVLTLGVGGP